jgi:predicted protein tyrosine phosphatase
MTSVRFGGFRRDGRSLLLGGWPTHVVLIAGFDDWESVPIEIEQAANSLPDGRLLRMEFHDSPEPRDAESPQIAQVKEFVEFIQASRIDRLLVICPGGLGRSAGMAAVGSVALGMNAAKAVGRVAQTPGVNPNRLVIALGDVVLRERGRLWTAYADWMFGSTGLRHDTPVLLRGKRIGKPG